MVFVWSLGQSAGIKNNTRVTLSVTCGDWWVFADYPAGIKNNTRAVLAVCGVRLGSWTKGLAKK